MEGPEKSSFAKKRRVNISSRILVMQQEIDKFRIRWSCLLDKLFTITITIAKNDVFHTMQPN
jgi:hypothetical protein